jgi:NIMA (never in mitosis gene a)-related kinase 7
LAGAGDLAQMIKHFIKNNKRATEKTIWKFFSQICNGLEHMHSKRIMHRGENDVRLVSCSALSTCSTVDIKPANIFVSAEGIVRLGDLGLGKFSHDVDHRLDVHSTTHCQGRFFGSNTTSAHSMVGTPSVTIDQHVEQ